MYLDTIVTTKLYNDGVALLSLFGRHILQRTDFRKELIRWTIEHKC